MLSQRCIRLRIVSICQRTLKLSFRYFLNGYRFRFELLQRYEISFYLQTFNGLFLHPKRIFFAIFRVPYLKIVRCIPSHLCTFAPLHLCTRRIFAARRVQAAPSPAAQRGAGSIACTWCYSKKNRTLVDNNEQKKNKTITAEIPDLECPQPILFVNCLYATYNNIKC